jgi:hypothetical protein
MIRQTIVSRLETSALRTPNATRAITPTRIAMVQSGCAEWTRTL